MYIVVVNKKEFRCKDTALLRQWKRERRVYESTVVYNRLNKVWTTVGQAILVYPVDGTDRLIYLS